MSNKLEQGRAGLGILDVCSVHQLIVLPFVCLFVLSFVGGISIATY
jgi:hypothetical protein